MIRRLKNGRKTAMEKYVVQCYQGQKIRSVWKEREGRWFFSVVDVLRALEVSANPSRYWSDFKRKLRQKTEKEEAPVPLGEYRISETSGGRSEEL